MSSQFRIWYSTESFARFIIGHSVLRDLEAEGNLQLRELPLSDASNPSSFHTVPAHIKEILYLDSPDLIVELGNSPILSIEISQEAGTGHNAFQRFGRLVAAVENHVPAFYIYPEAVWIQRSGSAPRWDALNPNVFRSLEQIMQVHDIPALLYYFPTYYRTHKLGPPKSSSKGIRLDSSDEFSEQPDSSDAEMADLFATVDLVVAKAKAGGPGPALAGLLKDRRLRDRRNWMISEYHAKGGPSSTWSPETAAEIVPTVHVLNYVRRFAGKNYVFTDFLTSREETVVYKVDAKFRGDPYPGALAALDYLRCRSGPTYEDRDRNLAMAWGSFDFNGEAIGIEGDADRSINRFMDAVKGLYGNPRRVLLSKSFSELRPEEIPRYYMQVRFGTTFTKRKEIRMYCYFCDVVLFPDGALWREG